MNGSRPELATLLSALGDRIGRVRSLEPLPSGTGGTSWLVTTPSGSYVAKLFEPDSPVLLGPEAQFRLLRVLADTGIVPAPVACEPGRRLLVTEFIRGARALSAVELAAPEPLKTVARLLESLHAVTVELPAFAPAEYAARYLDQIGGRARLDRADRRRYDELLELGREPLAGRRCACHNDLTADNLLFGDRLWLIDFDYAVAATPVLDLASLVVMNGFDAAQTEALLEAYSGMGDTVSGDEFARVRRIVRLLAHFWSLAVPAAATAIVAQYRIDDD